MDLIYVALIMLIGLMVAVYMFRTFKRKQKHKPENNHIYPLW